MQSELHVRAVHAGGMRMVAGNGEHEVTADYPLQSGEIAAGMRPLELLLAALATCGGSVVALLLQRMGQPIAGLEVDVRGTRRDEHPTVLTHISMEFRIRGAGVDPAAVEQAIKQADERLAPVWAMLKQGTSVDATSRVIQE